MCCFIKRELVSIQVQKCWRRDTKGKGRAVWSNSMKGPKPWHHSWEQNWPRSLGPEASKDEGEVVATVFLGKKREARRCRTKAIAKSGLSSTAKRVSGWDSSAYHWKMDYGPLFFSLSVFSIMNMYYLYNPAPSSQVTLGKFLHFWKLPYKAIVENK